MARKVFHHHRNKVRNGIRRAGEIIPSAEALRAQNDFPWFCEYLTRHSPDPKIQPPHMAEWNQHLLTGETSRALLGIAGPNVDILSPRGSAKSTYLGMFAAWSIGRHAVIKKLLQILYISYTVDVARPKSAAIKAIIESPEYREIFPMVVPGNKWSDEYWQIDYEFAGISTVGAEAFSVCCAGLKGGIVSKRCLVGATMVATSIGEIPIEQFSDHIGINVLAFNESSQTTEWRRVVACEGRIASDIVEVRTSSGRKIRCTSDHPFYVLGCGYRDARDLVSGQALVAIAERLPVLPAVRSAARQEKSGASLPSVLFGNSGGENRSILWRVQGNIFDASERSKGKGGGRDYNPVLLAQVPRDGERQATLLSGLRGCYWHGRTEKTAWEVLPKMPIAPASSTTDTVGYCLRNLPEELSPTQQRHPLLLAGLCEQGAFGPNGRRWQQSLQGWSELQQRIFRFTPDRDGSRLQERSDRKLDNAVPWVPCTAPQAGSGWEIDIIVSVDAVEGAELVYDIEVEGAHNFFANGVCVHNSHLVLLDDLIKSEFDIGNPEIREQMEQNWTRSILPTMFDGGRAICLGTRFRADDIHCTTFTPENGWVQIEQSAIVDDDTTEGGEKSYWDFWSLEHLQSVRTADPIGFSFQYQNKIVRTTEVSIHPDWIIKTAVPTDIRKFEQIGIGIDLSSKTKERHDFTVMVLGGRINNKYYILDMWRGRVAGNKTKLEHLLDLCYAWDIVDHSGQFYFGTQQNCYLYAEDVAYQASLQGDFKTYVVNELRIHNLIYRPVHNKGDKLSKLRSVTGLFENKLVRFNEAARLGVAIEELVSFGATSHDDCADAIELLLNGLRASAPLDIIYG